MCDVTGAMWDVTSAMWLEMEKKKEKKVHLDSEEDYLVFEKEKR